MFRLPRGNSFTDDALYRQMWLMRTFRYSTTKQRRIWETLVSQALGSVTTAQWTFAWLIISVLQDAMNEAAWCYLEGFGCKKDKVSESYFGGCVSHHLISLGKASHCLLDRGCWISWKSTKFLHDFELLVSSSVGHQCGLLARRIPSPAAWIWCMCS